MKLMAVTPPPAALAFTPSPFDYGQVGTGQTASQTFTLINAGEQAVGPLTATLTGSAAFTVTGDTCTGTTLGTGGSCAITVRFVPASIATFTATLTAASANPAATASDALTGTGVRLLYWANRAEVTGGCGNGTVNLANLDGTSPHAIVTEQACPTGVAVGASNLYWSTEGGSISQANLDGSNPHAVITPQGRADALAVDASHLHWTNLANGTIWEAGLDGSNAHAIITGQISPWGLAVSSP